MAPCTVDEFPKVKIRRTRVYARHRQFCPCIRGYIALWRSLNGSWVDGRAAKDTWPMRTKDINVLSVQDNTHGNNTLTQRSARW